MAVQDPTDTVVKVRFWQSYYCTEGSLDWPWTEQMNDYSKYLPRFFVARSLTITLVLFSLCLREREYHFGRGIPLLVRGKAGKGAGTSVYCPRARSFSPEISQLTARFTLFSLRDRFRETVRLCTL